MFITNISLRNLINKFKSSKRQSSMKDISQQLLDINSRIPMIIKNDSEKFKHDVSLKVLTKLNQGMLVFDDDYIRDHQDIVVGGLSSSIIGIYGSNGQLYNSIKSCDDKTHRRISTFVESIYKTQLKRLYHDYPNMSMTEDNIHDIFSSNNPEVLESINNFIESPDIQDTMISTKNKLHNSFKNQIKESYSFIKSIDNTLDFSTSQKHNTRFLNQDNGNTIFRPNKVEMACTRIIDSTPDISDYSALDQAIMELTVNESREIFTKTR